MQYMHCCVLTIIATLLIVERLEKDILSYQIILMIIVHITGQEMLVENAVQDSL